ncbi:MAG TPA: hypothetical protein VFW64_02545 [Pseudonocardiaceae bacterium]|nr:hypothetical protein [Pseudonocardiaceae bacterium]
MRPVTINIEAGGRFGRVTVIDSNVRMPLTEARRRDGSIRGPRGADVRCDCGAVFRVALGNLASGNTTSCGCLQRERVVETGHRNTTHGVTSHPHYQRWSNMIGRCGDPSRPDYKRYGGRGIRVCGEWRDVTAFVAYLDNVLGPCPDGCSLDRIDNNGNYEPGNVRWATASQQRKNQRKKALCG